MPIVQMGTLAVGFWWSFCKVSAISNHGMGDPCKLIGNQLVYGHSGEIRQLCGNAGEILNVKLRKNCSEIRILD